MSGRVTYLPAETFERVGLAITLAFGRKGLASLDREVRGWGLILIKPLLFFLPLSGRWFNMTENLLTGPLHHNS